MTGYQAGMVAMFRHNVSCMAGMTACLVAVILLLILGA
jgi:hypothetical protein